MPKSPLHALFFFVCLFRHLSFNILIYIFIVFVWFFLGCLSTPSLLPHIPNQSIPQSNPLYPVVARIACFLAPLPLEFLLYRQTPYYARISFTSHLSLLSRNGFFPDTTSDSSQIPHRLLPQNVSSTKTGIFVFILSAQSVWLMVGHNKFFCC